MRDAPDRLISCSPSKQESGQQRGLHAFAHGEHAADANCQDHGPNQGSLHWLLLGCRLLVGCRRCGFWLHRRGLRGRGHLHQLAVPAADDASGDDVSLLACIQSPEQVLHERCGLFLAVDVAQQVAHVLRVHGAGLVGHARRHVRVSDDGHTVGGGVDLARLRQFAVTATGRRKIYDDASGTHGGHGVLRDQQRRGSPRDGGCGDGDVALGQDFLESLLLHLLEGIRRFLGVAALALAALLEVHTDPLGAHRVDLVRDVTDIPGPHHGAHGFGSSDGGQTGDTAAQDEGLRRWVLACGSHLCSVETAEGIGGLDHGAVPCHLSLGAEDIQLLRNGDARDGGHVDEGDACGLGFLADVLALVQQPSHPGDDHLALALCEVCRGRLDRKQHSALLDHTGSARDFAALRLVRLVRESGVDSCSLLDDHPIAVLDELLGDIRHHANALIAFGDAAVWVEALVQDTELQHHSGTRGRLR
mmetsp:Transcript_37985/g.53015  ORF Transcript_37985/g.53015 Transcript_37985/m.53015 type:complete len:474 (+) Transcript_37985:1874-3295(+)